MITKRNFSKVAVIAVCAVAVLLSLLFLAKPKNDAASLEDLGIILGKSNEYKITEHKPVEGELAEFIEARAVSDILKIWLGRGFTETRARGYVESQAAMIESLFAEYQSPYPGAISNKVDCADEFNPRKEEEKRNDSWRLYYYLYSNSRLTFGGCSDDVVTHKAVVAFIYCQDAIKLYKIEYFTPKGSATPGYVENIKGLKCEE